MEKAHLIVMGWREWVALPQLNLPAIKAKVDTGAYTSSLHTFMLEPFERDGRLQVRFGVHPLQGRKDLEIICVAEVVDRRVVKSSNGRRERRYVIRTPLRLGQRLWSVEITLANRDTMNFRMLLGRTALKGVLVNPTASYLTGSALAGAYGVASRRLRRSNKGIS
ncbi:MAG TPA: ATP-dependent zinc protease [Candidatus Bipolaricaulota bacterium]